MNKHDISETIKTVMEIENKHIGLLLDTIMQSATDVSVDIGVESKFVALEHLELILNIVRNGVNGRDD